MIEYAGPPLTQIEIIHICAIVNISWLGVGLVITLCITNGSDDWPKLSLGQKLFLVCIMGPIAIVVTFIKLIVFIITPYVVSFWNFLGKIQTKEDLFSNIP